MAFNAELNLFKSFALDAVRHRGGLDWVARAKFTNPNGGLAERRVKSLDFADNDAPFALFRNAAEKANNRQVRQAFMDALNRQFNNNIPKSVLDWFTNGVSDKPLTARRIIYVLGTVATELRRQNAVNHSGNQINIEPNNVDVPEWMRSEPKQGEYEKRTDMVRHFGIKEKDYDLSLPKELREKLETCSKQLKYFEDYGAWVSKYGYRIEQKEEMREEKQNAVASFFSSFFKSKPSEPKMVKVMVDVEVYNDGKEEEAKACRPQPPTGCPENLNDVSKYLVLQEAGFTKGKFEWVAGEPTAEENQRTRNGLAKLYDGIMKAAGVSVGDRNLKLKDLLKAEVINKPIPIDEMKELLQAIDQAKASIPVKPDKTYKDQISQNMQRGNLKLNYQQLGNSVLKPLMSILGAQMKVFKSLTVESVTLQKGEGGDLKLEIKNLVPGFDTAVLDSLSKAPAGSNPTENSAYERQEAFFETAKGKVVLGMLKGLGNKPMDLSISLKPGDFDPATGKLKLQLKDFVSSNDAINLLKTKLNDLAPILPHGEGKMLNVALGSAGNSILDLELDLNRLGSEKLNGFGLNGSVAGNLRELKFEENGISLKLGDKQVGGNNQPVNGNQANPAVGQRPPLLAHTQDLTRLTNTVAKLLRTKAKDFIDFKGLSLSNADQSGAFEVKFRMLDLDKALDLQAPWYVNRGARLAGVDQMTNVSIKIRPALDPQTGHMRLTIASVDSDQLKKGLGKFVKGYMSSILRSVITSSLLAPRAANQPETTMDKVKTHLSLRPESDPPGLVTLDFDANAFIDNSLPQIDNDYLKIAASIIGNGKVGAFHANERGIHLELNDAVQNLV